jgi:hypothetical protein
MGTLSNRDRRKLLLLEGVVFFILFVRGIAKSIGFTVNLLLLFSLPKVARPIRVAVRVTPCRAFKPSQRPAHFGSAQRPTMQGHQDALAEFEKDRA